MAWAIEEKNYSQRRACRLIGMAPRIYRYRSRRPDDAGLRNRLRKLAAERRRFGYRRLHLVLKRQGVTINWKKLYRLYREERLTVRDDDPPGRIVVRSFALRVPAHQSRAPSNELSRKLPSRQSLGNTG